MNRPLPSDKDPLKAPIEFLKARGFESYAEYLKSDHWRELRARYMKSGRPKKCAVCGSKKIQLHHRTYRRLGKEQVRDLVPLCRKHHRALHLEYGWDGPWGMKQVTHAYLVAHGAQSEPKKNEPRSTAEWEAKRQRRQKHREAHRAMIRTIACPKCGAEVGEPCRSKKGEPRKSNHQKRLDEHALQQAA